MLDEYTAQLNALSTAGQQLVLNALQNAEWKSIAELRSLMVVVMDEVCSMLASDAAVVASDMYDDVREMSVGKRFGYVAPSAFDGAATEGAVRALVQSVVTTGATDAFGRTLQERVDYEVKRAAGECVKANAARDPLKPKWARVPSGSETCGFCLMLASRGFVYSIDRAAGSDGHYHPNCDCRIIPGFDGMTVEGYDPDVLYEQWRRAEEEKKNRRSAASVGFASESVKKRVATHELRTAERLAESHGMRPVFVQDFKWVVGEGGLKRKVGLPDLEDGTELKAILGSKNAHGALRNHLNSAKKKTGLKRVIVDNTDAEFIADEELVGAARLLRHRYPEIPVLSILLKSGDLVDI